MKLYLRLLIVAMSLAMMPVTLTAQSKTSKPSVEQKTTKKASKKSKSTGKKSAAKKVNAKRNIQGQQVKNQELKIQDELKENQTTYGTSDADGKVARTIKEEVIYERKDVQPRNTSGERQVFRSVEQMPIFPGGEAALMKYLDSHVNYPPMAAEKNIQGRVVVQFIVEADGSVSEVKVVRSVDEDVDREAIRVIKTLPKFTPGRQNGQAVAVWYTVPVTFRMQGTN